MAHSMEEVAASGVLPSCSNPDAGHLWILATVPLRHARGGVLGLVL